MINFCLENNKRLIQISTLSVSGNILETGQVEQDNIEPNTIQKVINLVIYMDRGKKYFKYLMHRLI